MTTATAPSQRVWATKDEGKTWYDTGGRTAGRHTTIVIAKNGDLLGYGGKNSNIDGRMPMARSTDGGATWHKSKTPFDPLASGERPSVIRLASGRLFFTGDFNPPNRKAHPQRRRLRRPLRRRRHDLDHQAPPRRTSSPLATPPQPRTPAAPSTSSRRRTRPTTRSNSTKPGCSTRTPAGPMPRISNLGDASVSHQVRRLPSGKTVATWGSLVVPDGRILLDGPETFTYPDGKPMWSVTFNAGHKTGDEHYLREDGTPIWTKHYADDGTWTWDNFDASGKHIAESHWRNKTLLSSDVPDPPARKNPAKAHGPDAE